MIVRRNFANIAKWMQQVATEISNAYTWPTRTLLWSFHKFYNRRVTRSCTIYRDESYDLMSSPCGLRMSMKRARYARFSRDKADKKTNERFSVVRTIIIIVSAAIRHELLIENRIEQRIFPCLCTSNRLWREQRRNFYQSRKISQSYGTLYERNQRKRQREFSERTRDAIFYCGDSKIKSNAGR